MILHYNTNVQSANGAWAMLKMYGGDVPEGEGEEEPALLLDLEESSSDEESVGEEEATDGPGSRRERRTGAQFGPGREERVERADVMTMQEVKMTEKEAKCFIKWAGLRGYYVYSVPGPTYRGRWGELRASGGLYTLVCKTIVLELVHSASRGKAAVLTVQVAGWLVTNCYTSPEAWARVDLSSLLQEQIVMLKTGEVRSSWITLGDFNDSVGSSPAATALHMANGEEVPLEAVEGGEASRWGGREAIDWAFTNRRELVSRRAYTAAKIADRRSSDCDTKWKEGD